jgi:hypothetical protein
MKVPDIWWLAFSGQTLNLGVIALVDLNINTNNHFKLKLDKEQGVYYAMRYDAVIRFANETHHFFSLFCLSAYALRDPADNVVQVETVDDDKEEDEFTTPPSCNKRRRPNKNI